MVSELFLFSLDEDQMKIYSFLPWANPGLKTKAQEGWEWYLHDKEEEDNDDNVDLWVDPHS